MIICGFNNYCIYLLLTCDGVKCGLYKQRIDRKDAGGKGFIFKYIHTCTNYKNKHCVLLLLNIFLVIFTRNKIINLAPECLPSSVTSKFSSSSIFLLILLFHYLCIQIFYSLRLMLNWMNRFDFCMESFSSCFVL